MNRKAKSIVNAAVAMGFGEASDYHGNSIAEVLEEVAAIAAQSSSGGTSGAVVLHDVDGTLDKTFAEIKTATNTSVIVLYMDNTAYYLRSANKDDFGSGRYVNLKPLDEQLSEVRYKTTEDNGYPARFYNN